MIKKVSLVLALLTLTSYTLACELPKGESLTIGCTYDCDFFYRFRLQMAGWAIGYPTKIVSLNDKLDIKDSLKSVDAVLLPGGADIDPKYYLNDISSELRSYTEKNLNLVKFSKEGRERDPFEYAVVKLYSSDKDFQSLPLLGICRGMQMMSVAQGIPLYLDIKTELGIKNRMYKFDRVEVTSKSDSLLGSIYSREKFKGFKLHHQGIRVPYYLKNQNRYPKTRVTSYSNNRKIAESIEYTHRPALGVQFHPERSFPGTSHPIFKWFLTKACEHKTSMKE